MVDMHALKMSVRTGAITEPDIFLYFAGIPFLHVLFDGFIFTTSSSTIGSRKDELQLL